MCEKGSTKWFRQEGAKILQDTTRKREIESFVSAVRQGLFLNADAASAWELIIGVILPRYGGIVSPFCVDNELVPLRHVAL